MRNPVASMWALHARATDFELIDGPVECHAELAGTFRDMSIVNRWFGGTAVARFALRDIPAASVLDVGCGIGDVSLTLAKERARSGAVTDFTCLDSNADVLEVARARAGDHARLAFVHGDGTSLPFADASFDVAMCNLALHHFAEDEAVALLRELRRVSRRTPVVTDLRRSALTWLSAYLFSKIFTRNRLTRHDAPLSARRAYTRSEALVLAQRAGWKQPRVRAYAPIRMVITDEIL